MSKSRGFDRVGDGGCRLQMCFQAACGKPYNGMAGSGQTDRGDARRHPCRCPSDGLFAGFTGADTDGLFQVGDENFAVTNFAGVGGLDDGFK